MSIRDATLNDINALKPILKSVFDASIFKGGHYCAASAHHLLATAISFDKGYAKVYEKNGEIKGLLGGFIGQNQWGVLTAQDTFMYSDGGSSFLIKDFYTWAKQQGAQFVQITDLGGASRYHALLDKVGFKKSGSIFIKGL